MSIEPTSVHSYVLQGTNIGDSDSCFIFLLLDNSIVNWVGTHLEKKSSGAMSSLPPLQLRRQDGE